MTFARRITGDSRLCRYTKKSNRGNDKRCSVFHYAVSCLTSRSQFLKNPGRNKGNLVNLFCLSRVNRPAHSVVSLVSMPFKDLRHPPIQLGILERCLTRVGITACSHSFELAFMEHIYSRTAEADDGQRLSTGDYKEVACHAFAVGLGDWIFKVPPYAEPSAQDDEYLDYARSGASEKAIAAAIRMKMFVPEFLTAAADEVLAGNPSIVGFSTVFQQNVASLVLAKVLKARDPSLTIVFGGGNCDGPMGAALHECFPWVDIVVRGEGERVFPEVVLDVLACRPLRPQPGLCYRVEGESIVVPQVNKPQVPMDEVPTPIYDEFFARLERSPLRKTLWSEVAILFESSRGCWWGAKSHCTFCGLNGSLMPFRKKPPARVVEEILGFASRYKILDFVAVDDIIDLGHIRDLLPQLSAVNCDLQMFYETKANLKKGQLRAFYASGINAIQPGVESLSTPILQLMRKGVTALQNIRLLKWCAEIGITPAWNILYGFPREPPEEYERMADLIPSLVHFEPPNFMPVQIQRFSPYFDRPTEFDIELTGPEPLYRFLYPVSQKALWNLAYDFEHRYLDGRDPETYVSGVRDAVQRWRQFSQDDPGYLCYRCGPDFLIIEDRRAGLEASDYRFDGIEAKIYLACDAGTTPDHLSAQFAADGDEQLDAKEIEEYLNDLVQARLMYREGNCFLSLAIPMFKSTERFDVLQKTDAPRERLMST
jgi:ribosomal peptide maturation radical SAM protein 1